MTETPTTELRIEGNLTLPNEVEKFFFETDFYEFIIKRKGKWAGNIVPKEDSTGMSLYKVEEVEEKDRLIDELGKNLLDIVKSKEANNREFLRVAAQLEQKEKEVENWKFNYDHLHQQYTTKQLENQKQIQELETELRLKENTRWKTFIKWVKEKVRNR